MTHADFPRLNIAVLLPCYNVVDAIPVGVGIMMLMHVFQMAPVNL